MTGRSLRVVGLRKNGRAWRSTPRLEKWEDSTVANYRYSRWDGTQQVFGLDEDDLLESLSDDIMAHGDLERALRDLFRRGAGDQQGDRRIEGLRELMERLRSERRQQLQNQNLESVMKEIEESLRDVVDTERTGVDRRLQEASDQLAQGTDNPEDMTDAMRLLEDRVRRNREALDALPESVAGAIGELADYDFVDSEARGKFQELLDRLDQRMVENRFQEMRRRLQDDAAGQMEEMRRMVEAINQMLHLRDEGLDPGFQDFMEEFGHHFDPDRPHSLDELLDRLRQRMEAMSSLMESMTPEMRAELEALTASAMDEGLMEELAELTARMQQLYPGVVDGALHGLLGPESVTLEQAMEMMGRLSRLDELEDQVKRVMRTGDIGGLDLEEVEELLGEEARRKLEELQQVLRQLAEAGYLRMEDERLELTPRAIRKLAQKALKEVFSALNKDRVGRHELTSSGDGGEHTGETQAYQFGDPLDIDLQRTLFNSVLREGPRVPVQLSPNDLEIRRTEHLTEAATVLLLDQSRSMGMLGSFAAAKRVALALYWLIQSRFPRDYFRVVGFSDYAIEIKVEDLARMSWNDWVSGTNMHHAFMLSNRLLSKQKVATKQIIMITDGEPTAHLEGEHAYFSYPPSYRTIGKTLKEVKRCTQAGITINTFMLADSRYLLGFVDKMTRMNRGRAFYSTPDRLGHYIMVDYLKGRRERITS